MRNARKRSYKRVIDTAVMIVSAVAYLFNTRCPARQVEALNFNAGSLSGHAATLSVEWSSLKVTRFPAVSHPVHSSRRHAETREIRYWGRRNTNDNVAMKGTALLAMIAFASCLSSHALASDSPHVDTCSRLVKANRDTNAPAETVSGCRYIQNSHSATCLEMISAGFTKYEVTCESPYDGIHTHHILACMLYVHPSSVNCLNEILTQRHPTISDVLDCGDE